MQNYNNYPRKLRELIEEFSSITDANERAEILIYYAEQFQTVPLSIASPPFAEEYRVPACESQAFVWSQLQEDGTVQFYFAVENPQGVSAKAMAVLLDLGLSGEHPSEIVKITPDIVYEIFGRNLSMGKNAGLTSLVAVVVAHAKNHQEIE